MSRDKIILKDCFANHGGKCVALNDGNKCDGCKFYKSKQQNAAERKKSLLRAMRLGFR